MIKPPNTCQAIAVILGVLCYLACGNFGALGTVAFMVIFVGVTAISEEAVVGACLIAVLVRLPLAS